MQEAQKAFKAMLERKCMLTKTLKDQVNQIQEMTIMHLVVRGRRKQVCRCSKHLCRGLAKQSKQPSQNYVKSSDLNERHIGRIGEAPELRGNCYKGEQIC